MLQTLAFGMPGLPELLIIAVIVLVLFGSRLPSVMRNLGKGINEFKGGLNSPAGDFDDEKKPERSKEID